MINGLNTIHLYSDLAWLWPMWGDITVEYAHYCAHISRLIKQHTRRPIISLLNIACGGGKNMFNLKDHYQVTGLDLSPAMLEQAKKLNPSCDFIEGDMRSFLLDRTFDAILLDDGISHMANRDDLLKACRTAFRHLNPGGVMITTPDTTTETFRQNHTTITPGIRNINPGNLDIIFIENLYDPDPTDENYEATILFLIRENGLLRIETDQYILGLFSLNTWRQILSEVGFMVQETKYRDNEDEYTSFTCIKPQ